MFPLLPAYLLAITIDDPKVRELCPNGMITTKKEYALSSSTPFLCLYGNYAFVAKSGHRFKATYLYHSSTGSTGQDYMLDPFMIVGDQNWVPVIRLTYITNVAYVNCINLASSSYTNKAIRRYEIFTTIAKINKRFIYEHCPDYTDYYAITAAHSQDPKFTLSITDYVTYTSEPTNDPTFRTDGYFHQGLIPYCRYLCELQIDEEPNSWREPYFEDNLWLCVPTQKGAYSKQQVQDYTNQQPNYFLDPDSQLDETKIFTSGYGPWYLTEGQIEGCNSFNTLDYFTGPYTSGTVHTIKTGESLCMFGGVAVASDQPIKAVYKYFNSTDITVERYSDRYNGFEYVGVHQLQFEEN